MNWNEIKPYIERISPLMSFIVFMELFCIAMLHKKCLNEGNLSEFNNISTGYAIFFILLDIALLYLLAMGARERIKDIIDRDNEMFTRYYIVGLD